MDADRLRHMVIVAANLDDAHDEQERLKEEFDKDPSILFCITTRYGMFRHISNGFIELTGWQRHDTNSLTWHSLIHDDDVQAVSELLGRMDYLAYSQYESVEAVTRIRHREGHYIKARVYVVGWTRDGIAYTAGELVNES